MSYNMTFVDTSNTLYDLFSGLSVNGGGGVVILLLAFLYVALFAVFKNYETSTAITGASFIMSIVSGLFWFAGFIAWYIAVVPLTITIGGLIISFFKD